PVACDPWQHPSALASPSARNSPASIQATTRCGKRCAPSSLSAAPKTCLSFVFTSATPPKSPAVSANRPHSPKNPFATAPVGRSFSWSPASRTRRYQGARIEIQELIKERLVCHRSHRFFDFGDIHHHNRIPWATIEERTLRPLADAFLAPDT